MNRISIARMIFAAALLAVGCDESGSGPARPDGSTTGSDDAGPEGSPPPPPPSATGMPCGVAEVFGRHCLHCHVDPPRFGAPMPLVTWDHLHADGVSDGSRPVYELVAERIHDDEDPMPPPSRDPMPAEDVAVLDAWIASGAPMRPASESCEDTPPPPPPMNEEELPCEPSHEFLAHAPGSADAPFEVPTDAGNLYQCFYFRNPFPTTTHATAWAPVIGDERTLHHWILFRSATPQEDGSTSPCNMPADATFMMGWAPGAGGFVMPDDVGLEMRVQQDEWLILQIHYWNVPGYDDVADRSGVKICSTDTPRENTAGVFTFGSPEITIPPRARDHDVVGNCPSFLTSLLSEPLNVLASWPHMHERGTRFQAEIIRPSGTETLVDVGRWDFNAQLVYPHDPVVQINPGDAVRTTCTYDNPTSETVTFGERTEDEMCFNFAMVYPIDAIPSQVPRVCWDGGGIPGL